MADRYAYLPFIGLFIMMCWGVAGRDSGQRVDGWKAVATNSTAASAESQ